MSQPSGTFYLGETVDPATHERTGEAVHYDASRLTTHGVIVGMTGSGKTGLGIVLLEEALLQGVPCLVIDPKGDMGNLLLTFPELSGADFEPWVNPGDAERKGKSTEGFASDTADLWRSGLESWGLGPERIRTLRERADFTIYTPGSTAGVPLNVVGAIGAPSDAELETVRDEVEGFVTSLLGLVGIEADPIASREHVLLSNLMEHAWQQGRRLDLAGLVTQVQSPPLRKLGVFELDTFFPPKDRLALAMRLNGLIASPSFEIWTKGPTLDIGSLLQRDGRPQAAIVSLAHLSEEERQFVVTLLLSRLITWMRSQSGTTDLRALTYMDEVFGYVPPTAAPPSKKPILTILKQARAFGVGMVLSTQNPVDVDYKALSNAGTWMIGRLQTERDKKRLMEGLRSAAGGVDLEQIESTISGLGKREFLLHSTKAKAPIVFGTRWAMSYLRGPLSREQIANLMRDRAAETDTRAPASMGVAAQVESSAAASPQPAADESTVMPKIADGVPVYHLDPAAPWAADIGADGPGGRLEPALAARVHMIFDDTKADLRHQQEWETIFFPLDASFDPESGHAVDYDERDFRAEAPGPVRYALSDAPLGKKGFFSSAQTQLKEFLYRNRTIELLHNPHLKLYSRVGEDRTAFLERCQSAAEEAEDQEVAKIRDRLETRMDRVRAAIAKAEDRVEELETDTRSRKQQELVAGVGSLLGAVLGGRTSARRIASKIGGISSRRSMTARTQQRLETARNRVEDKAAELEQIERDLADEILEIDEKWRERAEQIETIEVGLEKTDVRVDELAVVWLPRSA